jgi:signal transduction histidine kinase
VTQSQAIEPVQPAGGPSRSDRAGRLAILDERGPRWYQSLYWRAAIALIGLVAILLATEAAMFLFLSAGKPGTLPSDPSEMPFLVASDVSKALTDKKDLDLGQHLRAGYGHYLQTILVSMLDGRIEANHDDIEPQAREVALQPLERRGRGGGRGFFGRGGPPPDGRGGPPPDSFGSPPPPEGPGAPPPDGRAGAADNGQRGSGPGGQADGRGGPPFNGAGSFSRGARDPFWDGLSVRHRGDADIVALLVDGTPVGRVVVMRGEPPFRRLVSLVGPQMALVAGGVLAVGGTLIALVVFGPARRRLRQVQDATEQLGAGDLAARAPEEGGDEITAVARSFNHMADELTRRAKALETSDRARRQLLADVSHELMTPLTAMRGYLETLSMVELQLDPAMRERYMRIVTEETNRLENIISDLLDLARLEGGGTTMRRERVVMEGLFKRVAERHEQELTRRNIVLDARVHPGAEQTIGDPDRLEQALQNLVANALRYTPDEGTIALVAERQEPRYVITIRDSGPGIPDDQFGLIFDRFYKADAPRRSEGGSGLGLAIVKAIIERHGGTITVRNDGGAVFEISLP